MHKFMALALSGLVLAGCGTVTRGTSENVEVYYDPPKTRVTTNIGSICDISPCSLKVSRKKDFVVKAELAGYKPQTVEVKSKTAPGGAAGLAGNVLVGGVIGAGVDLASGAMLSHYPNPVVIEMEPVNPGNPATPRGDLSDIKKKLADKEKARQAAMTR